jgi:hypothetical protein
MSSRRILRALLQPAFLLFLLQHKNNLPGESRRFFNGAPTARNANARGTFIA